ncbi:oxidoreductase family protein [Mycena floridula]|nr:oxidoreductase family protein [Mycena floridula]
MPANIAILGAGGFAINAYLPALASITGYILKAVYSRSEASAQQLADAAAKKLNCAPDVYFDGDQDLDALLKRSDIDAVLVVLPISLQPSIILKALAAGKHVLSEKPVAKDVETGLALIKEYNEKYKGKLTWKVAENFEAEPVFQKARQLIAEGRIGDVCFFKASAVNCINESSITPWRRIPDYQGGFVLDGGVHTIAALRTMLPLPMISVSAYSSLNKSYLVPVDTVHAVATTATFHGLIELSFGNPIKAKAKTDSYVITGSKGWIAVNNDGIQLNDTSNNAEHFPFGAMSGVERELANFFDAVAGKPANEEWGNPLETLKDVAWIQAALNSKGSKVDLEKLIAG